MASGIHPPLIASASATPPVAAGHADAALPPCLIVNPRSFNVMSNRLAGRATQLARANGADVIEVREFAQLAAALDSVLARGTRQLFVLAGDGTVHGIIDQLVRLPAACPMPQLLILAGGRTNLIAADLGGGGAVLSKLEAALVRARNGAAAGLQVQYRNTLAIEQAPAPPRHGFFVAAAVLDTVIRECHRHRMVGSGTFRTGKLSTAWCLLQLALRQLFGRNPVRCPDLDIDAPGCGRLCGTTRVLMATTLSHRIGLLDPYARRGTGAVRVTAVAARAAGFWRTLPRLLTGRFSERMNAERGYLSGSCEWLQVRGLGGYTLDGEEFETDPAKPVVFRTGPSISFLQP